MIEAIRRIGEYSINGTLTNHTFLNGICIDLPETKFNKKNKDQPIVQHVILINFNCKQKKIELDFEVVNAEGKDSSTEYCWVGNAKSNNPKIYITSNLLSNIIKALPIIKFKVEGTLTEEIEFVLKTFFEKKEYLKRKKLTSAFILSISQFDFPQDKLDDLKGIKKILTAATRESEVKSLEKKLYNKVRENIFRKLGLRADEVALFTIQIDNQLICQKQEYKQLIVSERLSDLFENKGRSKKYYQQSGTCSICGGIDKKTTSDSTSLDFKFYTRDKLGFSSNFDGRFTKNYNMCIECYQYLLVGEKFIQKNLQTKIGSNSYIIPRLIYPTNTLNLTRFSEYIRSSTNSLINLESLNDFQKQLDRFREYEENKNNYILNYLFYRKEKSAFNVLKLIKDIPPTRLDLIRRVLSEINYVESLNYGEEKVYININTIWRIIPLKKVKDEYVGVTKFLDIIDAIFSDIVIDYNFLINQMTEVIKIIRFEREGFNVWSKYDRKIFDSRNSRILQMNLLLLFFKKMLLIGGLTMNNTKINTLKGIEKDIPEEILNYWTDIELYEDTHKKALFLLGYLIGEIGNAQSSSGLTKKPILNKINYQGMSPEKLHQLTSDVFEKLRHIKSSKGKTLLEYKSNEIIYSVLKLLMDTNIQQWDLPNQENVFYTISGYSYSNFLLRMRRKKKKNQ